MSNYRTGNDYWIAIGKEYGTGNTGYGTGRTVSGTIEHHWMDLTVFPDKLEIGGERATIDTGYKTLTGIPMPVDKVLGNYNYTLTISGILSLRHEIFLQGLMTKTGNSYVLNTIPDFIPSFVILRVWNDPPIGVPAETYIVDKFKGAQLTKLTITGTSGDMVKYEATFNITEFDREVGQAIIGDKPLMSDINTGLFNFGDMEFDLAYGENTEAKSFSFNIGYEFPDDSTQYMNSLTRLPAIPLRVSGEFNYVNNYNKNGYEKLLETLLYNAICEQGFSLINNSHSWSFGFYAQPISYSLADPDKALFENNITFRLAVSDVGEAFEPLLDISIT